MHIQFSEKSEFFKVHKRFCEMSCKHYGTNHITWANAWGNQGFGDNKGNNGIKVYKAIDK